LGSYDTRKLANESISQYANRILLEYRKDHVAKSEELTGEDTEYSKTLGMLAFLEDLGVLASRGYLKKEDLFDFMGKVIMQTEDVFKDHIKWIRKKHGDPCIFANALILMRDARLARASKTVKSFNEGEYAV
jgi:hypothetical protein